jgi:hypothetical protein
MKVIPTQRRMQRNRNDFWRRVPRLCALLFAAQPTKWVPYSSRFSEGGQRGCVQLLGF